MFNKKEKKLTEQELQIETQKLFQQRINGANKEILEILNKYGLDMIVDQVIKFVPQKK